MSSSAASADRGSATPGPRGPAALPGWREIAAVLLGGMLGTGLRLGVDALVPSSSGFPWSTLAVNVLGSFALGVIVASLWGRPAIPRWLRVGLGVGVLGSFTTFSAVAVSLVSLASTNEWMLAAAYLAATVILGLGAAVLGLVLGSRDAATPAPDWREE